MSVTIYHNPKCSKSRQTLSILEDNGVKPVVIEYLKTPPSRAELVDILGMLELSPRDLMRKGETVFKENNLGDMSLTDQQLIDAMLAHPKLIERPIVTANGKARIGRPPESILEIV